MNVHTLDHSVMITRTVVLTDAEPMQAGRFEIIPLRARITYNREDEDARWSAEIHGVDTTSDRVIAYRLTTHMRALTPAWITDIIDAYENI